VKVILNMTRNFKRPKLVASAALLLFFSLALFFGTSNYSGISSSKQSEYDIQRQNDILAISDMIEAYYEINNHYPLVKKHQPESIDIFISDNIPLRYPSNQPYQLLEAELQNTLGIDAVLPKDPAEDGIPYQYSTNGLVYRVAAYLYHEKPYAWNQGRHANKVEVTNSPYLEWRSYRPHYLRHILKFGPDDESMQAEFMEALKEYNFEDAKIMLSNGANPSPTCQPNYRCQPLATAAMNGDLEIMEFLIDNDADLDGYNSYNNVALVYAIENQQLAAAQLLVDSGANVNIPNLFGMSPFIAASVLDDIDLLISMIENGAYLNRNYYIVAGETEQSRKSMRPLRFAIMLDEIVSSNISSAAESLETTTIKLARQNLPEMIVLLLAAGADPTLQTGTGETIAELGRISNNKAIRELF
jgi:hypothetical protein